MRMELWRCIPVNRPSAVMFEGRGDPTARRLGRMIPADASLDVALGFAQCERNAGPMRLSDAVIAADERGQRHALGRRERRIPPGAMSDSGDRLAMFIGVRAGGLVLDERRAREGML